MCTDHEMELKQNRSPWLVKLSYIKVVECGFTISFFLLYDFMRVFSEYCLVKHSVVVIFSHESVGNVN